MRSAVAVESKVARHSLRIVEPAHSSATLADRRIDQNEASVRLAQMEWDQYLAKMLATFKDPNPDLCRDLALDRTIRALGQRPMTFLEMLRYEPWSRSGSSQRVRNVSERDVNFYRKLAKEDAFEELCSSVSDN